MENLVKQTLNRYQPPKLSWPKDWLIKLISLFFAVFLWYFVAGQDRVDMNVRIPVEIVNLPRNLVVSNQFKDKLEVTVSGPRSLIRDISRQDISRSIDLSNAKPGNIVIDNTNDSIPFPRGITVLRIQPSHIILLLDKLIQKDLPIKYITTGSPPRGYELDSITLEPDHLTISGPQRVIGNRGEIRTKPINLTEIKSSVTKQVLLKITPEISNLIGEPSITANIKIKKKMVEKEVGKIHIEIKGLARGQHVRVSPRIIRVKARLPMLTAEKYQNLRKLFHAEINAASLTPGSHELTIKVSTDPEVFVEEIIPPAVKLTIKK